MARWATLWDVVADTPKPIGLAVEHPGHVHVYVPSSYYVPSHFEGEYRVLQPDGSLIAYRPGDEQYFQQVLANLSHAFSVGRVGQEEGLDDSSQVIDLYMREIVWPQQASKVGAYRPQCPFPEGELTYQQPPTPAVRTRGRSRNALLTAA